MIQRIWAKTTQQNSWIWTRSVEIHAPTENLAQNLAWTIPPIYPNPLHHALCTIHCALCNMHHSPCTVHRAPCIHLHTERWLAASPHHISNSKFHPIQAYLPWVCQMISSTMSPTHMYPPLLRQNQWISWPWTRQHKHCKWHVDGKGKSQIKTVNDLWCRGGVT